MRWIHIYLLVLIIGKIHFVENSISMTILRKFLPGYIGFTLLLKTEKKKKKAYVDIVKILEKRASLEQGIFFFKADFMEIQSGGVHRPHRGMGFCSSEAEQVLGGQPEKRCCLLKGALAKGPSWVV